MEFPVWIVLQYYIFNTLFEALKKGFQDWKPYGTR